MGSTVRSKKMAVRKAPPRACPRDAAPTRHIQRKMVRIIHGGWHFPVEPARPRNRTGRCGPHSGDAFDGLLELGRHLASPAGVCSPLSREGGQAKLPIQRHPALSGSERDSCGRRDRLQRAVMLQMRLKQAEPLKGELSGLFRESRQLVHTRRVRQIACKVLRQIICKVTGSPMPAGSRVSRTHFEKSAETAYARISSAPGITSSSAQTIASMVEQACNGGDRECYRS